MTADTAFRNVTIVDGSGAPAVEGDVAINGDRVSAVGRVGRARHEVDGTGLVLAPGFVDVHTHDDTALISHPGMEFKVAQGCTSVVIGNCGFSAAPATRGEPEPSGLFDVTPTWTDVESLAEAVTAANPAVNAMTLVGHNTVRSLVMEDQEGPPTTAELERMRRLVADAMAAGACGFSTGLVYEPGRYSQTDEIITLATEAAQVDGLYATHLRNEWDKLLEAIEEAITIGDRSGCSVQISHHKSAGANNWGKVADSLARIDRANAEGSDITLDVYPYTAGSGPMAQYFDLDDIDPELAEVIRFASCPAFRHYEGRMAVDIAAEFGLTAVDVIRQVLTAPEGSRTICIKFIIDEGDIETNLRHELMMVGSDGLPDLNGSPHPRLFGTFPRILGHYVREKRILSMEDAVRRMTSMSCERFGLVDRGLVAEGYYADLVLFDPIAVVDTATFDDPKQEPIGVHSVYVNGIETMNPSGHTGRHRGRFLRYRQT